MKKLFSTCEQSSILQDKNTQIYYIIKMEEGIDAKQCIVCKDGKNKDSGELHLLKGKGNLYNY